MERLTSDSPKGNFGNILNLFYVRDQAAWVRGGGSAPAYEDVSLYDFARQIISVHIPNADTVVSDDILDEIMAEWLLDGPETKEGLIALLYNAAWAFAELRERLSTYEDTGLTPDEIVKMGMAWEDSKRYAGRSELKLKAYEDLGPVSRLRELAQADKDGRLAVLPPPAKLGDPKPECFYNDCAGIWCIGYSHGEDDEPTDRCKQCWYCENGELEDDYNVEADTASEAKKPM